MAGEAWVVVGTVIGTAGSVFTTWLNAHLKRDKSQAAYDAAAMDLLKQKLEVGDRWQKIVELANVIGLDQRQTKEYLLMLGARGHEKDGSLWGLARLNPFPVSTDSN